jgi:hypothetical protein
MESAMKMLSWSRYRLLAKSLSRTARRCHHAKMRKIRQRHRAAHRPAPGMNASPERP